jgi:hypothetical protein
MTKAVPAGVAALAGLLGLAPRLNRALACIWLVKIGALAGVQKAKVQIAKIQIPKVQTAKSKFL